MHGSLGIKQGWVVPGEPGETPADELGRALIMLQRRIAFLVEAIRKVRAAHNAVGQGPRPADFRGLQEIPDDANWAWSEAIADMRSACPLWREALTRAEAALPPAGAAFDRACSPGSARTTATLGRLLFRLRGLLPAWLVMHGKDGDQYARNASGLPDPDWALDVMLELDEYVQDLGGITVSQRPGVVRALPESIKRVIALVRADPASFVDAIRDLESTYTTERIEADRIQTIAYERDTGLLSAFEDRDVELSELEAWDPGRARAVLPDFIINTLGDDELLALAPLRLAFHHASEDPWQPDLELRHERVSRARRFAVLTAWVYDPDVAEYLGAHSAWAGLGWPVMSEAADEAKLSLGRHWVDPMQRYEKAWAERCERVATELLAARCSEVLEPKPLPEDIADILTDSEIRAIRAEHQARDELRAHDSKPTLARIFDCICAHEFEDYNEAERVSWERTRRRANTKLRDSGFEV